MTKYNNLEKNLWLVTLAFLACFATIRVIGLPPDAALYAGLAKKVWLSGEFWLLRGSDGFFPKFYEHPPYFFQWGAWLMGQLGYSDVTAKLMGAIPSFFALLTLTIFVKRNWGWSMAAWTLLMLATTGHYTKYAATALLDAPLSLFTLLSLLSTFYFLRAPKNYSRLLAMLGIFLGVAGACASKGVVGLGCVGGAVGSYVVIVFLQNRPLSDLFRAWFLGVLLLMAAFLPFLLWIIQSFRSPELWSWIGGYFEEQVLRSATTNRGETFYGEGKNYFYFLNVIVRNLWPWWWSVPLSYIAILRPGKFFWKSWVTPAGFKFYGVIAGIYFLSFFVPLSLVTYKLPHYLHPTYLLLAPVGAWSVSNLMKSFFTRSFAGFESLKNNSKLLLGFRWGALVLVGVLTLGAGVHLSSTANRGQEFYNLGLRLSGINPACSIWIPQDQTAPYRMEAFSLWYLDGRPWKRVENAYPSKIAVPPEVIYWDPSKEILWLGGSCT